MLLSIALEDAGSQLWDTGCDAKWFSQKVLPLDLCSIFMIFFNLLFTAVLGLDCACDGFL